eukprot:gnl/MRDRNA2_/MRDRNA2_88703_c0_seq1.p1 gnl/MRDRNA2_/MRDRNA2_88703_c0~~gnl/MRDRNA2_/MRDRNA2_88703_c0_seq1.p1  ORF type:complete len:365 (-),score=62.49 gnl/MRDRNA2_/MRDRNA2_88703_c0_seq1:576-1583(-)
MTSAMMIVTFAFALRFAGSSATCEVDGANCQMDSAAMPGGPEQGLALFQHGTTRSFVVTARAGAGSKLQMSEPETSLLLEDGREDDIKDASITRMTESNAAAASTSDVADPSFYFRMFLDFLVFLIVVDGVCRYRVMYPSTPAETVQSQKPVRTGSQVAKYASAASKWLHEAIRLGDVAKCAAILEDADAFLTRRILSEPDVWGCNALHLAADSGSAEIVSMLLERGGRDVRVNAADVWDQTPLHFAARNGSVAVCKILIDHGASMDAVDAQEHTALHVAAKCQHEATCEFLLDQGAGVHGTTDANLPSMLSNLLVTRIVKQHLATPLLLHHPGS